MQASTPYWVDLGALPGHDEPFSIHDSCHGIVLNSQGLVPPHELRVVGVGEMLGDDAFKVRIDHGAVQRFAAPRAA